MKHIFESVVVLTGASSGIARATALRIAEQRGTVVLASRQEAVLRELAAECQRRGGRALAVPTDVTQEEQVKNLAHQAIAHYGRIDAWVNAAAVYMLSRFEEAPADAFRRIVETNFFGYVNGARAALPWFRRQGRGVLVNIASVLGKIGAPFTSPYVASKFAVTGFSESLRLELRDAPDIHVCTVFPATVDTPFFQHAANFTGRAVQAVPPVYSPTDVADAVIGCIVKPKREVTVGNVNRLLAMRSLAPPLAERLISRKMDAQNFQDITTPPSQGNLFEPMPDLNCVRGGWGGEDISRKGPWFAALALGLGAGLAFWYWYSASRRRPRTAPPRPRWQPRARMPIPAA